MPDDKTKALMDLLQNPDKYATSEEMAQIIARILREVKDTRAMGKRGIADLRRELAGGTLRDIRHDFDELKRQAKADAKYIREVLGDGPNVRDELERLEDLIEAIPRPQSAEKIIAAAVKRFTEVRPDYAEDVRTKLEFLQDDERLDISAIKGVDERLEKYWQVNMNRAIAILDRRTQYLINKATPTGGGGSGGTGTWYSVSGTIDGSNATFTIPVAVASDFILNLGGQMQIPTKWYNYSVAGGITTITYQAGFIPVGIPTDEHKAFVIS